jgi:hypothetical protein
MMRTLFLNPPSCEGFDGGAGSRYQARREIRSYWYPTWLAQPAVLYTSSPTFAGDVQVAEALKAENPALVVGLAGFRPQAVGFSLNYLANVPEVVDLAKWVKTLLPDCLVFAGGHSVSFMARQVLAHADGAIDVVLKGEGETGAAALLAAAPDRALGEVPGAVTAAGPGRPPRMLHSLDEHLPARHLGGRPAAGYSQASFGIMLPLVVGLVTVVGGCLAVAAWNQNLRPLALALACGVNYGVAAFTLKLVTSEFSGGAAEVLASWPVYLFAVVGPLGFLLNQHAFQRGTFLTPVQAIITTADPVVSTSLGIVWLHVRLRSSPAAVFGEVGSLLLMIAGIVITAAIQADAKHPPDAGF